jgi:NADP-dependent 3-hydroxy acid dehydrogenase YdfG
MADAAAGDAAARRIAATAADPASADDPWQPTPPPPYDVLSLANQTALITGASSGIGEAIAWRLAREGISRLVLVARRKHRLDALAAALEQHHPSLRTAVVVADLSDPKQAEALIPDLLPPDFRDLDILINNAGLALGVASVADNDLTEARTMLETNVYSVVALTKAAVRLMLASPERQQQGGTSPSSRPGHVVFLSSVAGHEAYGGGSVYCATKHALEAFATATRHDLVSTPIRVTSVAPGAVWTEFSEVRFRGDKAKADAVYGGFEALRAADIADEVAYCLTRPARVQITDVRVLAASQCSAKGIHRRRQE